MDKLEELKQKIKVEIEKHEQATEEAALEHHFVSALQYQHFVSALEMVLGMIAEVEGDETFF